MNGFPEQWGGRLPTGAGPVGSVRSREGWQTRLKKPRQPGAVQTDENNNLELTR